MGGARDSRHGHLAGQQDAGSQGNDEHGYFLHGSINLHS